MSPDRRLTTPAWVRCECCPEFWCSIHQRHAFECDCPPIEEWETDPYTERVMTKWNPQPNQLWSCDNGAIICTEHLGHSATVTGRDISGQRVRWMTDEDREFWAHDMGEEMRCERCPAPEDCCPGWERDGHSEECRGEA